MAEVRLLLKGGTIYDGTGAPAVRADIGIDGADIVYVGTKEVKAAEVLDLRGLAVAPGFIDTHGHSEFTALVPGAWDGKLLQGITTEINGNCGLSAGPMLGEAVLRRKPDLAEYGITEGWATLGEYLKLLEHKGLGLNFASLVGHGSVRGSAVGYSRGGPPSASEMSAMEGLVADALGDGAIGLSTGLIYPPGIYADTDELIRLARAGRKATDGPFIYASHIRGEGDSLLEALAEAVAIGEAAGVSVHVSHIKTAGRENWHKVERAIEILIEAQGRGMEITCDRYPYTASSTDLDTVLPDWAYEGGNQAELDRLDDPLSRQRMIDELPSDRQTWEGIVISSVGSQQGRWLEGLSISDAARRMGLGPAEAVLEILRSERLRVGAVFYGMSEENLARFLGLPFAMVGTDSAARGLKGPTARGRPHPRGFGSMPRFINMFGGTLEEAVRRLTSLPAATFGLKGRGVIKESSRADLVVFDPARIRDKATFEDPFLLSEGIVHVMVNGVAAVLGGCPTGKLAGLVLRHGSA